MSFAANLRPRGTRRSRVVVLSSIAAAAVVLGATAASTAASASTTTSKVLTYRAVADAYTSSTYPNTNYGADTLLQAGHINGDTRVAYLKFTVSGLPSGGTISGARLTVTRDAHHLPGTVQLSTVGGTGWSESGLTHNNEPALGTVLSTVHPTSATTSMTFDVSPAIKAAGTYAFALTSPVTNDVARVYADEGATVPSLAVSVTVPVTTPSPSPSTASPSPTRSATPSPTASTAAPSPTASATATSPTCTVSAKLVPTCNILWGAAAGGFTSTPRDQALKDWEAKSGRTASIYHTYHVGDEQFPTASEIAMASDQSAPRLLFTNWKVDYGTTFARVAAGAEDGRIDTLAAYIKSHYTSPFFMAIHHEPENDVNPTAGSGKTAADYAAMYRHTVQRMRADGVTNVVFVMAYMSYEKWFNSSWWGQLYPGDDVIDWVGVDSYLTAIPGGFHYGDFGALLDRTTSSSFPGFYQWSVRNHPTKPVMLAEWGIYENTADLTVKPKQFDTVLPEIGNYPALKAIVYFDSPSTQTGGDLRIDSSAASLTEFRKVASDPRFVVRVR